MVAARRPCSADAAPQATPAPESESPAMAGEVKLRRQEIRKVDLGAGVGARDHSTQEHDAGQAGPGKQGPSRQEWTHRDNNNRE